MNVNIRNIRQAPSARFNGVAAHLDNYRDMLDDDSRWAVI